MPIERNVLERDARSNIADWPAVVRYNDRLLTVHCSAQGDVSDVLTGGLLDDMSITIVAISSDFGGDLPQNRNLIELQLRDGSWQQLEIQRVPDLYDPLSPTIQLQLGNVSK